MAISTSMQTQLANQQAVVDAAYNDLDSAAVSRDNAQDAVNELERQKNVHLKNGDTTNAQIVNGQLQSANGYLTAAKNTYNVALTKYKAELTSYVALKNQLSAADRIAQDAKDANDPALNESASVNTTSPHGAATGSSAPRDPTKNVNYAQTNTKYLMLGVAALIIIVVVVLVKRKSS